ncbi:MAG: hypothetical protein EB127_07610 [Alphaproteobacteria bacterium]|nr:hypothetical protein [Alphaproteobacteria bacterium]
MSKCIRCYGSGVETYEDYYRVVEDTCYHCGGTGKVDSETAFQDDLELVANRLAAIRVDQIRKAYNSDPDGEGWAFRAAENMMSERDYTACREWEFTDKYIAQLANMDRETQEVLVAWNNYRG